MWSKYRKRPVSGTCEPTHGQAMANFAKPPQHSLPLQLGLLPLLSSSVSLERLALMRITDPMSPTHNKCSHKQVKHEKNLWCSVPINDVHIRSTMSEFLNVLANDREHKQKTGRHTYTHTHTHTHTHTRSNDIELKHVWVWMSHWISGDIAENFWTWHGWHGDKQLKHTKSWNLSFPPSDCHAVSYPLHIGHPQKHPTPVPPGQGQNFDF